jgi:uncharacterized membrane protein (UPF0127 family)
MFLSPLVQEPRREWVLEDAATGAILATRLEPAFDSAARRRGLLGRVGLDRSGLVLAPCSAVHTFFMRFPIDIVFTDRNGTVVKVRHDVRPWRIAGDWRAFATIELATGAIARAGTSKGHRLQLRSRD